MVRFMNRMRNWAERPIYQNAESRRPPRVVPGDTPAERLASLQAIYRKRGEPIPEPAYALPPRPDGPDEDDDDETPEVATCRRCRQPFTPQDSQNGSVTTACEPCRKARREYLALYYAGSFGDLGRRIGSLRQRAKRATKPGTAARLAAEIASLTAEQNRVKGGAE